MPRYDFECEACRETFEVQVSISDYTALLKDRKVGCPKCGSKRVARVFSPPSIISASSPTPAGGCCCPEGNCE